MKLEFYFKNINGVGEKQPVCRIALNGSDLYTGKVKEKVILDSVHNDHNTLKIFFENKEGRDTIIDDQNQIKQDLNFELERLIVDGIDLKHLIWESKYISKDDIIESCLFFGPKGHWEINFDSPILKWVLRTNHAKNKNDPDWEEGYNYYEEACLKLEKIK
jgi:hypothetical protein